MRLDIPITLTPEQTFCIFCKTLSMDFVYEQEDTDFYIKEHPDTGELAVWLGDRIYDDRGELFVALRNVAVLIVPNLYFRNADYIYSDRNKDIWKILNLCAAWWEVVPAKIDGETEE